MPGSDPRKIQVVFYRTRGGSEVVRDWLRSLDTRDRNAIGLDLMRVQANKGVWTLMAKRTTKAQKRQAVRSTAGFGTLDGFLKDQGKLEEFQATAIKEVLAWQITEAMKANNISRKGLAERMKTSRSQISRLLDPKDGNVTLSTLQRAAKMVGRSLRLELV
jgi:antitoxin HicB